MGHAGANRSGAERSGLKSHSLPRSRLSRPTISAFLQYVFGRRNEMSKLIGLAFAAMLLLPSANPVHSTFVKYKAVEAYEIRPGILMMPRYSADGQVCEIGLEGRHYSSETIRLDPSLTRKEVDQIFEELVPPNERGAKPKGFERDLITQVGHGITTNIEFENVSFQIFSQELPTSRRHEIAISDIAATVHWKSRKCQ